ncbi:MAG: methionine--tRNA ligase, partial [Candidatus Acidiferrales bacterium]
RPHVGSAYTTIVCDVIARYKRMCGYEVAYLTGTDEHGVNIERAAEKLGISPQELVDRNQQIFRDLWKLLGIQYTDFIRTTSKEHAKAVQALIVRTLEKSPKAIEKRKYEGRYCIYDNLYVSDSPEPADCPICGRPAELISEENYFFRLSDYQERLLDLYRQQPDFVQPDFRFNEVKSFVEAGLKDVSISRKSIKWGIPWPDDPEHVFYVWYDALTSYMSGIGYANDDPARRARFDHFWPADVHMIGKEIIRFHAVYWPAFLMAAEFPLPKRIHAHGWLLFEQEKMSKSKGNVAYPEPIVKVLGNDALRYYLLRETVFGQDGNFSREALLTRYEADLVSGLGNLASRVLAMIENYFGGIAPEPFGEEGTLGRIFGPVKTGAIQSYEAFDFSLALQEIWQLIAQVDGYLVKKAPWKMASDPSKRAELSGVLYDAAEAVRVVSILSHPVLPQATAAIWKSLGQSDSIAEQSIRSLEWGGLKPGTRITKPEAVFPRLDYKEVSERIEAMEQEIRNPGSAQPAAAATPASSGSAAPATAQTASSAAPAEAPGVVKIGIEDFAKVEMRVGLVKSAEKVAGADKLLKLMVDVGDEVRQIVAGIATAYQPEELVGRKVVVVANLAPRKLRGVESNGMLLAASTAEGKPVLCTFAEEVPAGARLK